MRTLVIQFLQCYFFFMQYMSFFFIGISLTRDKVRLQIRSTITSLISSFVVYVVCTYMSSGSMGHYKRLVAGSFWYASLGADFHFNVWKIYSRMITIPPTLMGGSISMATSQKWMITAVVPPSTATIATCTTSTTTFIIVPVCSWKLHSIVPGHAVITMTRPLSLFNV